MGACLIYAYHDSWMLILGLPFAAKGVLVFWFVAARIKNRKLNTGPLA
jgi:hypothetical protein